RSRGSLIQTSHSLLIHAISLYVIDWWLELDEEAVLAFVLSELHIIWGTLGTSNIRNSFPTSLFRHSSPHQLLSISIHSLFHDLPRSKSFCPSRTLQSQISNRHPTELYFLELSTPCKRS